MKTTKIAEAFFFSFIDHNANVSIPSSAVNMLKQFTLAPLYLFSSKEKKICPNCDTLEQLFGNVSHHHSHRVKFDIFNLLRYEYMSLSMEMVKNKTLCNVTILAIH